MPFLSSPKTSTLSPPPLISASRPFRASKTGLFLFPTFLCARPSNCSARTARDFPLPFSPTCLNQMILRWPTSLYVPHATLPRCVCVTSCSCAGVRGSRTEIGHSSVHCRRPVPLVCVVQRAFFQQGNISTSMASALLHRNQNDAFSNCRSAPRFCCDSTLPTRKFCSVQPANCSAYRISFTTDPLTGLLCICFCRVYLSLIFRN